MKLNLNHVVVLHQNALQDHLMVTINMKLILKGRHGIELYLVNLIKKEDLIKGKENSQVSRLLF